MQTIPTLRLATIVVEFLVAGNAPYIGGHAVLSLENFLRPQRFIENRAAPKQLRAQFRFRVGRWPEAVHPRRIPSFTSPGIAGMA